MSDTVWKWAARQIDGLADAKGSPLTFSEAAALVAVLSARISETVETVRPPVDEWGTSYPDVESRRADG